MLRGTFIGLCLLLAQSAALAVGSGDLALIEAVKERRHAEVKQLLAAGADVNQTQPDGATALSWAAYLDDSGVPDLLLAAGAKAAVVDEYGDSPLTLAASNGNSDLIVKLLAAGADAKAARLNGETALMLAAGAGAVTGVKALVAGGAEVNAVEAAKGQDALMWAAAGKHSDVVEFLVGQGADVTRTSTGGFTALAFAATKDDAQSVKSLIGAGADAQLILPDGTSVLMAAAAFRNLAAVDALINGGADVTVPNSAGVTALHTAAQLGDVALAEKLLAKGADPNAKTAAPRGGRGGGGGGFRRGPAGESTPLLTAANAGNVEVMKTLVAGGADPKIRAQDGSSLLMNATASAKLAAVEYAYSLDDDVTVVTDSGTTLMHQSVTGTQNRATQEEICEVISFLASKGAALDLKDGRGRTPIQVSDVIPIDKAGALLYRLILASGETPLVAPKDIKE